MHRSTIRMDLPRLRKLVALDPNDPLSRYALGRKLFEMQDGEADLLEAIEHLRFANAYAPEHLATYHILGQALLRAHDIEAARAVFSEGIDRSAKVVEGMGRDLNPAMRALLEQL